MAHRAAPFITQHLVLALEADALVWNMYQAYADLEVALALEDDSVQER